MDSEFVNLDKRSNSLTKGLFADPLFQEIHNNAVPSLVKQSLEVVVVEVISDVQYYVKYFHVLPREIMVLIFEHDDFPLHVLKQFYRDDEYGEHYLSMTNYNLLEYKKSVWCRDLKTFRQMHRSSQKACSTSQACKSLIDFVNASPEPLLDHNNPQVDNRSRIRRALSTIFEAPVGKNASQAISRDLKNERSKLSRQIKILFDGTDTCGKNNLFNGLYMRYMTPPELSPSVVDRTKTQIYTNLLKALQRLIKAAPKTGVNSPDLGRKIHIMYKHEKRILSNSSGTSSHVEHGTSTSEVLQNVRELFYEEDVQMIYQKVREQFYNLYQFELYFLNHIERICSPDFTPGPMDMLCSNYFRNSPVLEFIIKYSGLHFHFVNLLHGSRNWIHFFQDTLALVFVVPIADYDKRSHVDPHKWKLRETLEVFNEVCNSRFFSDTSVCLFFNNVNEFREKLKTVDLRISFPEYAGGPDFEKAIKFMSRKFNQLNRWGNKRIYVHYLDEHDKKPEILMKEIFQDVKSIILHKNLHENGYL